MKLKHLGMVKQMLKHKKVFIVLDDVDDLELLKTLVGQAGWFGPGSRIIVITQDRQLLKSHKINLVYEVDFPSEKLALQMFCRSAFGQNSPPHGFMKLANEVTELSGNLPLGLDIMGSSLSGRDMEEWLEMMPRLRTSLDGRIEKTLRVSYHGLDVKDQEIFLYIACLLNGHKVEYIRNVIGDDVNIGLRILAHKSLIRIEPQGKTVEMHSLLQMLGKDIVRAESIHSPGKRRFLMDTADIRDVLTDNTGTETLLGISFNTLEIKEPLFIDENSFRGMHNLQFLKLYKKWSKEATGEGRLYLPQGLAYLPRKLKILYWDECPLKCMPFNFRAECLVELTINESKLEKLWQGTPLLGSLKKMTLQVSENLKEIPDLSYAINLENLNLFRCTSLVTLPSSIGKLQKLRVLKMSICAKLEVLPADVNLESLDHLDLRRCSRLREFPKISRNISFLSLDGTAIKEEDSFWVENIPMFTHLDWEFCPLKYLPSNFHPEYLVHLSMLGSKLEKLWEGVPSLGNLMEMTLSSSENLKEFPNLSKATNLERLYLNNCKSLVMVPSSIGSLSNLCELNMEGCTGLETLPTNMNLESLTTLNLSGCSQLREFPQISTRIHMLYLDDTAIEEVPSWIKTFSKLYKLTMSHCKKLKNISPNICNLKSLQLVNFSGCRGVTDIGDANVVTRISRTMDDWLTKSEEASIILRLLLLILVKLLTLCAKFLRSLQGVSHSFYNPYARLKFHNCLNLDRDARELITQSDFEYAVLPGGEVPKWFMHRAYGSSLTIPLRESSLFEKFLGFKVCIVFGPPTEPAGNLSCIEVRWCFRGKNGVHRLHFDMYSTKRDHLLMFHFGFITEQVTECPSELDYDDVKVELYYHLYECFCNRANPYSHRETCPRSAQTIKGCGIEFWDLPPPPYSDRIFFHTELNMSCGSSSSDEEECLEDHLTEDDLTFSTYSDEGEYLENLPSDSVSNTEAIAQWLFEYDGELEDTYNS